MLAPRKLSSIQTLTYDHELYPSRSIHSGIDYNHPNLGGGFGPGNKVIGGYDLVGEDGSYQLSEPRGQSLTTFQLAGSNPTPDDDPLDTCNGIGSHLAVVIVSLRCTEPATDLS